MIAGDGNVYDKKAIQKWFKHNKLKPVVKDKAFKDASLKSNGMVNRVMEEWISNRTPS